MTWLRFVPLCFVLACTSDDKSEEDSGTEDTGDTGFIERPEQRPACDPDIQVGGTSIDELGDPRVGDEWTLQMWCDDVLQIGAYTLSATPPDLVSIDADEPIVTFVAPGEVTIDYQFGRDKATFTLTIVEGAYPPPLVRDTRPISMAKPTAARTQPSVGMVPGVVARLLSPNA